MSSALASPQQDAPTGTLVFSRRLSRLANRAGRDRRESLGVPPLARREVTLVSRHRCPDDPARRTIRVTGQRARIESSVSRAQQDRHHAELAEGRPVIARDDPMGAPSVDYHHAVKGESTEPPLESVPGIETSELSDRDREVDGRAVLRADQPRQHLAFIHALRGVASLLVVWAHLGTIWPSLHGETSYLNRGVKKLLVVPFRVFQDGGHLGVILFFLISGYIITFTALREDRTAFAVKRVLRLLPPLAVALLAAWGYISLAGQLNTDPIGVHGGDISQWFRGLFLLDGWFGLRSLDVTWTLVIEILFYTFTFILLSLTRRRPDASTWAISGLWVATCLIVSVTPYLSTSSNVTLPAYVSFLLIGRCIYLWKAGLVRPMTAALNCALALVTYLSFTETLAPGLLGGATSPTAEPLYTYAYAFIIFLALMSAAPRRTIQPFTMLGKISYSLYLLHIPVGFLTFEITSRWGFPPDAMILSAIAASIASAWVSYLVVERPSQRLARRLLRRRHAGV